MAQALTGAVAPGPRGIGRIVTDTNAAARALYARPGFAEAARRAIVPGGWQTPARDCAPMLRGR